jgi:membrane-bound lytic murein transglycosylase D
MNKILKLLMIFFVGMSVTLHAQQAGDYSTPDKKPGELDLIGDNFILAALDSLSTLKYFESNENTVCRLNENKYNFLPNFIPSYPDSVYYYRMQRLDVGSPINLTYNSYVRMFIDMYANKKRGTTSRVLGLAQMYFPMFEQQLDKYNVPLELKYLAIVESALNAKARSRVGAGGLWQFMYYTGKVYGLEVTSYVDDRNDPLKATVAACRHFNDLYNMYHDWLLVLAAYNSGPGNVNKAIRRSGGKMTFWEIMPYLPRETRDYVPAFIAVNYVMAYSNEHNIYPVMPKILYHETDTVAVHQPLTLGILSDKLKLNISELEFLNPTFRTGFIPATPDNPFFIRLPQKSIADFINNEPSIYAYYQLKGYDASQFKLQDNTDYDYVTKKVTHKVRKGETLATIARKYDCSTSEIKKWNKLKRSSVAKGQTLKIYVQSREPAVKAKTPKTVPVTGEVAETTDSQTQDQPVASVEKKAVTTTVKPQIHVVKKGESLGKVANKYHVTTKNLVAWNNLKSQNVLVGQKIRVNAPGKNIDEESVAENKDTNNVKPAVHQKQVPSNAIYHVVKKGEFLNKIATTYGVTTDDLVAWNSLETNNVLAGQKLRVNPPDSGDNSKAVAHETPVKGKTNNSEQDLKLVYYTVKPGDTLWSIAQRYDGITIDQLKAWNKISSKSGLKVGQKIKVILPAAG